MTKKDKKTNFSDLGPYSPIHVWGTCINTHLYNVVNFVVVTLSNVHTYCLEDHAIAIGASLDGVCTGDHLGVPWAAERTGLSHTVTRPTVLNTC